MEGGSPLFPRSWSVRQALGWVQAHTPASWVSWRVGHQQAWLLLSFPGLQFSNSPREGSPGTGTQWQPGSPAEGAASPAFPEALNASSYLQPKAAEIQLDLENVHTPPS